jgi:SAM-dependent methyltransferase
LSPDLPPFDKYVYYSASVQEPETDVEFLDQVYRDVRGRRTKPRTLREDFCGTFANCCAWVKLGSDRYAIGVDIDPEPLAYGTEHYLSALRPSQRERVRVLQRNVLSPALPKADVIAALNFSAFIFKRRADLLAYARNCRRTLAPGGVLLISCLGGPAYQRAHQTRAAHSLDDGSFVQVFEQEGFEPLTHDTTFHLHYQRPGEDLRPKVFTYDWRLWTVPELRDILLQAGFSSVLTYWEGQEEYAPVERADETPDSWISDVVALR